MVIDSFKGPYRFLSNFAPVDVVLDGVTYPSVEHAYQAGKTLDLRAREPFRSGTAAAAKKNGKRLALRGDWEFRDDLGTSGGAKMMIMYHLLKQKFSVEPYRQQLLSTGDVDLVEGNWWGDTFWGVCGGVGENHLGKLLMRVRAELRAGMAQ
jgi:ribA/ribD-fused uncharacterized protein